VRGLVVEVAGPIHEMSVGARVVVETDKAISCEVVGFSDANALLMPFAALEGVRRGCRAVVTSAPTYPDRVHGAAAAARTGRGRAPALARSPACSACWSTAATITSRSPMRCAPFSTATWSWST
jgi:hypothetical protein